MKSTLAMPVRISQSPNISLSLATDEEDAYLPNRDIVESDIISAGDSRQVQKVCPVRSRNLEIVRSSCPEYGVGATLAIQRLQLPEDPPPGQRTRTGTEFLAELDEWLAMCGIVGVITVFEAAVDNELGAA